MESYTEQLAKQLGVELEEEFFLGKYYTKFKITEDGMFRYFEYFDKWLMVDLMSTEPLIVKGEIIKLPKLMSDDEIKETSKK